MHRFSFGDQLRVWCGGTYWHHGIYVADGWLIHLSGIAAGKQAATVRWGRIEIFGGAAGPASIEVVRYAACDPPGVVVARARGLLGRAGYHVLRNNCEQFARWCKTGQFVSEQVEVAKATGGGVAGGVGATLAAPRVVAGAGAVVGTSGSGVMSGLAAAGGVVGGGAAAGVAVLAAAPAAVATIATRHAYRDDAALPEGERRARRVARTAGGVSAVAGTLRASRLQGRGRVRRHDGASRDHEAPRRGRPGAVDAIVVEDASRVSRDMADSAALFRKLKLAGVPLLGVADGTDTAARGAKVSFTIKSLLSDMYLEELSDKTKPGHEGRWLAGYSTGSPPIRYKSAPEVGATGKVVGFRVEIDPETAPTVRRIFELYEGGYSLAAIAKKLNFEHVPSPRAKTAHRRKGWVASSVREILAKEAYVGGGRGGRSGGRAPPRPADARRRSARRTRSGARSSPTAGSSTRSCGTGFAHAPRRSPRSTRRSPARRRCPATRPSTR